MQSRTRFFDDGKYLRTYSGEVHVMCIRCGTAGTVVAQRNSWRWLATFECSECGLQLDSSRNDWVGPVCMTGRRPCGYCGHKWLTPRVIQEGWPREVLESVGTACRECGRESSVRLEVQRIHEGTGNSDPHFGMPLLLVDTGRHGTIWAYNAQHVDALMAYITATLRERGSRAGNSSMFSRLPAWIKSAKNRESVARRLVKLKRLLPNSPVEERPRSDKSGQGSHIKHFGIKEK